MDFFVLVGRWMNNLNKFVVILFVLAMMGLLVTGVYAKGGVAKNGKGSGDEEIAVSGGEVAGVYSGGCGAENGKITGGGQITIPDGKASFGFNVMEFSKDEGPKGELDYIDHMTGIKVHAHSIDIILYVAQPNPGNKPYPMRVAQFEGPCMVNHKDGYWFKVFVVDEGEPGKNDQFYIDVVGPNPDDGTPGWHYENPQGDGITLLAGNIQIHKPPR